MNTTEVKKLLGLGDEADLEMIETALEEKLFNLKKDILPLLPVPSLIKKRQTQLDAWITLEDDISTASQNNSSYKEMESASNSITFLELYEKEISNVKLELMNASSFHVLKEAMSTAAELQTAYMNAFRKFFSEYTEALPEETKSREMIDTGRLLNALKNNSITSEITWEIEKELARINKLPQVL